MSFEALRSMWLWLSPAQLLLLVGGLGFVLVCTPWRMLGRVLLAPAFATLLLVTYTPFAAQMIKTLEDRFPAPLVPPASVTGILVLGGAELADPALARNLSPVADMNARHARMAQLLQAHPQARAIYAGALAEPAAAAAAAALADSAQAKALLQRHGIDPGRVQWVENGLDTFEAMIFARDRAQPQPGETWLLVTSGWHMPRAMGVAQRQGWKLIPQPVAEMTGIRVAAPGQAAAGLSLAERAIREWSALTLYAMFDRTNAWFPAPGE